MRRPAGLLWALLAVLPVSPPNGAAAPAPAQQAPGAETSRPRAAVAPEPAPVLAGIDVLARDGFAVLGGGRTGLLTNQTGRTSDGRSTIDVLRGAPGVTLVALFSPEHGIRGVEDAAIASSVDEATGLPIHSLYGDTRRPTAAMLAGIETLVVDLQDVGVRFYTYATTVAYVMEEAAKRDIRVVVLDRPDPIDGRHVEGPAADEVARGFTAYLPAMPVRHGLTIGELARLMNGEAAIGADLTVVPVENWSRGQWFDDTGLTWIDPSPNMRSLDQATLYPGIGAIEWSNISVGRGTDRPFEQVGAPWIDGPRLARALNERRLPGIRFYPVVFTPSSSQYSGEACAGVFARIVDRNVLRPVRVGLEVAAALLKLHPDRYRLQNTGRLLGSQASLDRIVAGEDPASVAASWSDAEARWQRLREPYLLYR